MTTKYTICKHCDHFIEEHPGSATAPVTYMHLDDGDQEYDHDPVPFGEGTMEEWQRRRPDLFTKHPDGKIGPNSEHHSRRGKSDEQPEAEPAAIVSLTDPAMSRSVCVEDIESDKDLRKIIDEAQAIVNAGMREIARRKTALEAAEDGKYYRKVTSQHINHGWEITSRLVDGDDVSIDTIAYLDTETLANMLLKALTGYAGPGGKDYGFIVNTWYGPF